MLIIVMLNNTIEYYEVKFNERHDSIISTVRSFSAKLSGAINQGIVNLTLIVSGIYAISQKISDLEVKAGCGEIIHDEVLSQADGFISTASSTQLFILRLGITIVPILAFLICLIILRKKYKIDEDMYEKLLEKIQSRRGQNIENRS